MRCQSQVAVLPAVFMGGLGTRTVGSSSSTLCEKRATPAGGGGKLCSAGTKRTRSRPRPLEVDFSQQESRLHVHQGLGRELGLEMSSNWSCECCACLCNSGGGSLLLASGRGWAGPKATDSRVCGACSEPALRLRGL